MPFYSRADRTSNVTSAAACYEIRTSTPRCRIMELGLTTVTAAATVIGIGRPAAIGVTPTSPGTVVAEDAADAAGTVTTAMAWGTAPTVPANFFRRWSFPATIGSGVIFSFPRGLIVPASSSIVFWNVLGGATLDVYVVEEE